MRKPHYLKVNDRSETIHQCVWYDCETTPHRIDSKTVRHDLVFGWAAYRRRLTGEAWSAPEWHRFTPESNVWQWIASKVTKRKTLYVWAHNESFDYCASNAHSALTALGWKIAAAIVDSPPFVVTYRQGTRKLVIVDTLNIWRMSLEKMGKLTGLAKLTMPPSWSGSESDDAYCKRDVEIILKAVCDWADFLHANDMGKFCLTVASQSMQTFRHRYLKDQILIDCDTKALEISRAAYHGGRTEAFFIGKIEGPLYLLDINSLYPYVMRSGRFPVRLIGTFGEMAPESLPDVLLKNCLCAHVRLRTTEPIIPVVVKHKLVFPVGEFDAYVSSDEIDYLLQHHQITRVYRAAIYEPGRPFTQFVDDMYDSRLQCRRNGKTVESEHYKLLLNSFYGKWGQNGIKWHDYGPAKDESIRFWRTIGPKDNHVIDWRQFNGIIQWHTEIPESSNSHPAIAAHITAQARMVLWTFMRQATRENYFYCDTDSILVGPQGYELLAEHCDNETLGKLKLVGQYKQAIIYGAKDYELDGVKTIKGISKHADEIRPGVFTQMKWHGIRGLIRSGTLAAPLTSDVTKVLRRVYDKGTVTGNGFVFPFHF